MSTTSVLRTDLLPDSLVTEKQRITISTQFMSIVDSSIKFPERSRTPQNAKNLNEFYELVQNVITQREILENFIDDAKVFFTAENVDIPKDKHIIVTFNLEGRMPGSFGKGAPFESDITNQRPILRELVPDPDNPGYKRAILGYWHDNEVKLTVFARTNKTANDKALWFENIMQEYSWYFTSQGVARVLFMKRESDFVTEWNGVKLYGRPLHYFVRTETLRTVSEKIIEDIFIQASLGKEV